MAVGALCAPAQRGQRFAVALLGLVLLVRGHGPDGGRNPADEGDVQQAAQETSENMAPENHRNTGQQDGEQHRAGIREMGLASYEKVPALLCATRLATSVSQDRFTQRLPEPRFCGFPSRGPAVILSAAPDWVVGGVVTKGSLIRS